MITAADVLRLIAEVDTDAANGQLQLADRYAHLCSRLGKLCREKGELPDIPDYSRPLPEPDYHCSWCDRGIYDHTEGNESCCGLQFCSRKCKQAHVNEYDLHW